jgi:cytochrome P450
MPGGTLISSSPHLMNYNEKVFQSPKSYIPERWMIDDPVAVKLLEDCWAPFSKGSRGCIGKNLALAEIYLTIGTIIRRYRLAKVVDAELNFREVFGVIFDTPVRVLLEAVEK